MLSMSTLQLASFLRSNIVQAGIPSGKHNLICYAPFLVAMVGTEMVNEMKLKRGVAYLPTCHSMVKSILQDVFCVVDYDLIGSLRYCMPNFRRIFVQKENDFSGLSHSQNKEIEHCVCGYPFF